MVSMENYNILINSKNSFLCETAFRVEVDFEKKNE